MDFLILFFLEWEILTQNFSVEYRISQLKDEIISVVCFPYTVTYQQHQHAIEIIEFNKLIRKLNVVIGDDLHVNIYVHRTLISDSHMFWNGLPRQDFTAADRNYVKGVHKNNADVNVKNVHFWGFFFIKV